MKRSINNLYTDELENFFITLEDEWYKNSEVWKDFKRFVKFAIEEIESENEEDEN